MVIVLCGADTNSYYGPRAAEVLANNLRLRGFDPIPTSLDSVTRDLKTLCFTEGHVDCLVLVAGAGLDNLQSAERLAAEVRSLPESYIVQRCIRARSLPVLFLWCPEDVQSDSIEHPTLRLGSLDESEPSYRIDAALSRARRIPWCTVVRLRSLLADSYDHAIDSLEALLIRWKKTLIEELDRVGFALLRRQDGEWDISEALVRKRGESQILAPEATSRTMRAKKFLLLGPDFVDAAAPYRELKELLNSYLRIARERGIKPESVFQEFFEAHPDLVLRDGYTHLWSKPRIEAPNSEAAYIEPDFLLRREHAAIHISSMLKVLDLKLPDEKLLTGRRLHKTFSKALTDAIAQVNDYRQVMSRPDLRVALKERFGVPPEHPQLAILIGRTPDADARDLLRRRQYEQGCADVQIIPYDSILEDEGRRLALKLRSLKLLSSSL